MSTKSDLFPEPKVGDAIAQSRYPYPPHKRTIAKVTATRITDDAGNVWRRSDGKKVGDTSSYGDRSDVSPWTDAHTAECERAATVDALRLAADRLIATVQGQRGIKAERLPEAKVLTAAIYAFIEPRKEST